LVLANLAAPLAGGAAQIVMSFSLTALPAPLWLALPSLPLAAAAIGCLTAQITVRRWLRHLP
jgi:hypothetical protein